MCVSGACAYPSVYGCVSSYNAEIIASPHRLRLKSGITRCTISLQNG